MLAALQYFLTIQDLREATFGERPSLQIEELMYRFRHSECTVAQDKIYALLSLLSDDEKRGLPRVDYQRPWYHTFNALAKAALDRNRNYDILSINNVEAFNGIHGGCATWAPQWDNHIHDDPLAPGVFSPKQPKLYNAGAGRPSFSVTEAEGYHILHAQGAFLDTIVSVAETMYSSSQIAQYLQVGELEVIRTVLEDRCPKPGQLVFQRIDWRNTREWLGT
jgi:hypothetical protein